MRPAIGWDSSGEDDIQAGGWTVMGRIRDRQQEMIAAACRPTIPLDEGSPSSQEDSVPSFRRMTPVRTEQEYEERLNAWQGGYAVLAFLFAQPGESAIRTLDERGEYFDIRTGDTWDLFFPGYFRFTTLDWRRRLGARTKQVARNWYFDTRGFEVLRRHIETNTDGRWNYSGGTDLVLLQAFVPRDGDPVVDWATIGSGSLDADGETSLNAVVEKISRDIENGCEDRFYGVSEVVGPPAPRADGVSRDILISAVGAIGGNLATLLFG